MSIPSDLDISRATQLAPITDIAADLGIGEHLLEPYGHHIAKVS
ncbi:MAG: formate--tetrahydrofolate ligase, partial [Sciscionella sp.]